MINRKDIQQGSLDWHEIKWAKIGGTLSKSLFINSDTLLIDILSQKLEEFEPTDSFENYDMQRGKELEPFALQYLRDYTGIDFQTTGWLQCEKNELLGVSPDGISECEKFGAEIKCFARKKHTEVILYNEIPQEHLHQIIHNFTVNPKLEKMYFCAFRPESVKNFIKIVELDTVVNLGTKAKPVLKTVREWSEISRKNADELLLKVNESIEKLKF